MAIKVRGIDNNNDWTFGQSKANYKIEDRAIKQNVQTRLLSFSFDWFLDEQANIDWWNILGQKNNKQTIIDNVKITTLNTDGVTKVNNIEVTNENNRNLQIKVTFTTIYNSEFEVGAVINGN